jgi:hypothetical protein
MTGNCWQSSVGKTRFNDHHTLDGAIAQAKRYVDDAVK